jgi:hypothetical protein
MLIVICWVVLAAIHFLPALALFRPSLITQLYSVDGGAPVFLLLQHRAALFLGVFVMCIWAIFHAESRQIAVICVGISMVSFLVLYAISGQPDALRTIAIADLIGLPFLAYAGWQAFRVSAG